MQRFNLNIKPNREINTGESLTKLPMILRETIFKWENSQREKGDKFFIGIEEIAALLNLHEQTIRKYCNSTNPVYPPINVLIAICKITNDYTPWNYLNDGIKND